MSQLIAAISTPPGPGGVGILRLSGPGAIGAASQAFRPRGKVPLAQAPDRQLLYGAVLDRDGRTIDTGLAFVSRAPHSYTGEETAELQCHGSPMVLSLALEALYAAGARPARPGEFTQRAFLNGKLDLTQAEAVIDLIDAESPSAARQAAGQLTGALSRRIEGIYSALTDTMAHFCAVLDYPDEDLDPFQTEALGRDLQAQASALQALLATGRRGQMLAQGITCALIGRPNAGKSSLLNALAGYERAIVTHLPGTTRDTIEVKVELAGRPFRLVDTAGLRDSDDPIEQLGVDRSRQAMAQADLLLMVCDGTQPLDPQDQALLNQALAQADTILAVNKGDLPGYRLPAQRGQRPATPSPWWSSAPKPAWGWRRWSRPWAAWPTASSPRFRRRPPASSSPTGGRPTLSAGPWKPWSGPRPPWKPGSPPTPCSPMWRRPWPPWGNSPAKPSGRTSPSASLTASAWANKPPAHTTKRRIPPCPRNPTNPPPRSAGGAARPSARP